MLSQVRNRLARVNIPVWIFITLFGFSVYEDFQLVSSNNALCYTHQPEQQLSVDTEGYSDELHQHNPIGLEGAGNENKEENEEFESQGKPHLTHYHSGDLIQEIQSRLVRVQLASACFARIECLHFQRPFFILFHDWKIHLS